MTSKNSKAVYISGNFAHPFLCVLDYCFVSYNLNNECSSILEPSIFWDSVDSLVGHLKNQLFQIYTHHLLSLKILSPLFKKFNNPDSKNIEIKRPNTRV